MKQMCIYKCPCFRSITSYVQEHTCEVLLVVMTEYWAGFTIKTFFFTGIGTALV